MHESTWCQETVDTLSYCRVTGTPALDGIEHAFSTRRGGCSVAPYDSLNLGFGSGDARESVESNRRSFLSILGQPESRLFTVRQVHSARVLVLKGVPSDEPGQVEADAVVTDNPHLWVGILTADCYPILLADKVRRVVGAVHAGWRGTASGIVGNAVAAMKKEWGCRGTDIVALIGPGIGSCCYQVGSDVFENFRRTIPGNPSAHFVIDAEDRETGARRWRLDLAAANRDQLRRVGVHTQNIHVFGACTVCRSADFFSYRRDGAATGRMLSIIGLRQSPPE